MAKQKDSYVPLNARIDVIDKEMLDYSGNVSKEVREALKEHQYINRKGNEDLKTLIEIELLNQEIRELYDLIKEKRALRELKQARLKNPNNIEDLSELFKERKKYYTLQKLVKQSYDLIQHNYGLSVDEFIQKAKFNSSEKRTWEYIMNRLKLLEKTYDIECGYKEFIKELKKFELAI